MVHEADLPDNSFQDNYALDDDKNEEEFSLCQKMVHYISGNMVTSDLRAAVKAVLVFNAGCIVNKQSPMTKENIQIECLTAYKKSIADLDPAYFSEAARHFFMAAHRNKGLPITDKALYLNFQDSRNKMRSLVVLLLPQSLCL